MQLLMKFMGTAGRSAKPSQSLGQQLSLFALLIGLWGMNLFPVQRAELVFTSKAIVSPQRLSSLQTLSKRSDLVHDSIRWVHYQRDTKRPTGAPQNAGLVHVTLRLGVGSGVSTEQIQKELERLTLPSLEPESTQKYQSDLRAQRWKLATLKHQMALFELDRAREKHAILETAQAELGPENRSDQDEASGTGELPTKATAVVHRKINADLEQQPLQKPEDPATHQKTWQCLTGDLDRCDKRISEIEALIRQATAEASGTIALTGSPRVGVFSSPASISHCMSVAAFAGLGSLGLVMVLRAPRSASRKNPRAGRSKSATSMLDELGLKNFGMISIDEIPTRQIPMVHEPQVPSTKSLGDRQIQMVRRLVDVLLLAWVVCFTGRFLTDGNWRELLFTAPLSAFSSILFGV